MHPWPGLVGTINVDGSVSLSHEFEKPDYESNEHLTDEEVEAIVKRYGESQPGGDMQPTVKDVAEALHVEPGVVSKLLADVRSAKTQEDLKVRLDALEAENTELRERAQKTEFEASEMWDCFTPVRAARVRGRGHNVLAFMAFAFGAMLLLRVLSGSGRPISILGPLLVICAAIFILKRLRHARR